MNWGKRYLFWVRWCDDLHRSARNTLFYVDSPECLQLRFYKASRTPVVAHVTVSQIDNAEKWSLRYHLYMILGGKPRAGKAGCIRNSVEKLKYRDWGTSSVYFP